MPDSYIVVMPEGPGTENEERGKILNPNKPLEFNFEKRVVYLGQCSRALHTVTIFLRGFCMNKVKFSCRLKIGMRTAL